MTAEALPAGWDDLPFFAKNWPRVRAQLQAEQTPVYPPRERIFAALEACPPERTRVIILGQDPYHTPGKADGLAFSIPQGFPGRLDSLGNIFKELKSDLDVTRSRTDLSDWAAQGVLLLNTALSVPEGRPKAHAHIGWEQLVAEVLGRLDDAPRAVILWGKPAQGLGTRHLKHKGHLRVESAHPSPLSVRLGFFGSRPFSRVNGWLVAQGMAPIDWAGAATA